MTQKINDLGAFNEGYCVQMETIDEMLLLCFDSQKVYNSVLARL